MFRSARSNDFRLGRGPFVPGGSQLYGAGSLALLAPMPLRTVQALPHPAIVANENFFSHANLVSKPPRRFCQALFFGPGLALRGRSRYCSAGNPQKLPPSGL